MAQKYKTVGADGQVTGGPVYYIRAAFKGRLGKVLAGNFCNTQLHLHLDLWVMQYSLTLLRHHSIQHLVFHSGSWVSSGDCNFCIHGWYETNCKSYGNNRTIYGSFIYYRLINRNYLQL